MRGLYRVYVCNKSWKRTSFVSALFDGGVHCPSFPFSQILTSMDKMAPDVRLSYSVKYRAGPSVTPAVFTNLNESYCHVWESAAFITHETLNWLVFQ